MPLPQSIPAKATAFLWLCHLPVWAQCGVLSWDEYSKVRHSFPYIVRIDSQHRSLLMFGAQHSHDPHHPQFSELERLWREFRPELAFSEGGIRPLAPSGEAAIAQYGEPGLLRFLADRDHVQLCSLEPPEDREAAWLVPHFGAGQVKLFYVLRYLLSISPDDPRPLEEKLRSALDSVEQRQRLTGPPGSLKELNALATTLLPDLKDWRLPPPEWFDPTRNDTFLNSISRRSSDYRDCHMIPLFTQAVRGGKRVFVVVGGSHVVVQERALRTALQMHNDL